MPYNPNQMLKCSFAAVRFPIHSVRVRGGGRSHIHEYPHSPGGAPEKLGRKLYEFEVVPCFDAALIPREYAGLWPKQLDKLQGIFDKQSTEDLILPTIGKVRAFADKWERELNAARSLSGEAVIWTFIEDSESSRLIDKSIGISRHLPSKLEAFRLAGESIRKPPIWDQIAQAIDQVLAYKDQYELYSALIEAKLLGALSMLAQLDNAYDELKDPRNLAAIKAMQELWAQARVLYNDQKQLNRITRSKKTNRTMDVGQLAVWLYGDSTKSSELLGLNSFPDPFEIPAGTTVRYYQLVEQAS